MGLIDKAINWGYREGLKGIERQIQKVIKENRLVFLGDNNILFTDKHGKKASHTFDDMVKLLIEVGKWQKQMETLGLVEQDVKDILLQEYTKQKKEAK
jgi:hypothetical protein